MESASIPWHTPMKPDPFSDPVSWNVCRSLVSLELYPMVIQHNYGKSPCWMGKSTINGHFPELFWHNQRVSPIFQSLVLHPATRASGEVDASEAKDLMPFTTALISFSAGISRCEGKNEAFQNGNICTIDIYYMILHDTVIDYITLYDNTMYDNVWYIWEIWNQN